MNYGSRKAIGESFSGMFCEHLFSTQRQAMRVGLP